jgi:hypothetical protein
VLSPFGLPTNAQTEEGEAFFIPKPNVPSELIDLKLFQQLYTALPKRFDST